MQPIVQSILDQNWSWASLFDYDDTKGPVFFALYAMLAESWDASLPALRVMSILFFCLGAAPLLALARRCGIGDHRLLLIALLYALLPYHLVLGQLFMSEASFVYGASCLVFAFIYQFGADSASERRVVGPLTFGIILALLLHHRIHACAFGGAICLTALARDRWRSWPWWVACALAGLSRLPLMWHWGGLVGPSYQERYGLGLHLAALTYLAIALLPCTIFLLWPALSRPGAPAGRSRSLAIIIGTAALGVILGLIATPQIEGTRFMGPVATTVQGLTDNAALYKGVIAVLAALGTAGLAALMVIALCPAAPTASSSIVDDDIEDASRSRLTIQLAAWTILIGWGLAGLSTSDVFDRYLLAFIILLPIVYAKSLPRFLLIGQTLLWAVMAVVLIGRWFF